MKRGEIRWAEDPDWPRRPALILTRDEAIDHLNAVFVVLATTNIRGLATEVELGTEDGMPRPCVLSAALSSEALPGTVLGPTDPSEVRVAKDREPQRPRAHERDHLRGATPDRTQRRPAARRP